MSADSQLRTQLQRASLLEECQRRQCDIFNQKSTQLAGELPVGDTCCLKTSSCFSLDASGDLLLPRSHPPASTTWNHLAAFKPCASRLPCSLPLALCPLLSALCSLPFALCPLQACERLLPADCLLHHGAQGILLRRMEGVPSRPLLLACTATDAASATAIAAATDSGSGCGGCPAGSPSGRGGATQAVRDSPDTATHWQPEAHMHRLLLPAPVSSAAGTGTSAGTGAGMGTGTPDGPPVVIGGAVLDVHASLFPPETTDMAAAATTYPGKVRGRGRRGEAPLSRETGGEVL